MVDQLAHRPDPATAPATGSPASRRARSPSAVCAPPGSAARATLAEALPGFRMLTAPPGIIIDVKRGIAAGAAAGIVLGTTDWIVNHV